MECLILFNLVPLVLNQVDRPEAVRAGRSDGDQSNEKELTLSEKVLGLLNSQEFLYVFIGFLVVIVICFACTFHCRQSPSLEHLTDDCDKLSSRNSYKSIRNIKRFFTNTLLNFNNIDEQVAKEQDIKSIDSLTMKNMSKSTSKSRKQSDKAMLMHQKSSKSASVISKSDTNAPLILKINIMKTTGSDYKREASKKSTTPASWTGSLLNQ